MYVLKHMPAKTRMKPAMPGVPSARIKKWLQLQTQYQHQKVHKPSARQWHDHARSLTSNQTLQKPLVPKTPSIPRLTTSGNKTVTQRTIKHDANRSKIFSVSETTTTRYSAGIALRHEDTNTTTLNMESRYYSANGRSWIEPIQKCTDHFPAPSQCTGARDTESTFNTKGLALILLSNETIRKWFDHWQAFCLFQIKAQPSLVSSSEQNLVKIPIPRVQFKENDYHWFSSRHQLCPSWGHRRKRGSLWSKIKSNNIKKPSKEGIMEISKLFI